MFLKKNIKASGIAEVVIALSIISLCFTVASLVFIRATSTPMKFQDVKNQTEIQSEILIRMYENTASMEIDEQTYTSETDEFSDSLELITYTGFDDRIVWQQQWMKE